METKTVKCKKCNADIVYITTQNGRKMPCDAQMVEYQDNFKGNDLIVTPDGRVVKGTIIKKQVGGLQLIVDGKGYISHFATCPNAKEFRKK